MAGTNPCVVLDNGGDTLKYGFCNENLPRVLRNCIGSFKNQPRRYLGEELTSLRNTSGILLSRPFERGVITNWSCQVELWSKAFEKLNLRNPLAFSDISLLLTAAPFLPDSVACDTTEIVFEQFGFGSYLMRPAAWFSAYEYTQDPLTSSSSSGRSVLVIDSGFSSTHVMPFINLQTRVDCCRRLNVGGKLLTNYLKELVSYRQWNMMDEFVLMDQVKTELCYVSENIIEELKSSRIRYNNMDRINPNAMDPFGGKLKKSFVLPDFQTIFKGFVKPDDAPTTPNEQLLAMENERFSVPEVLFRPSDIGIDQAGVAETAAQSIIALWELEQPLCAANIVCTGGNSLFPGFQARLDSELRTFLRNEVTMKTILPEDPITYSWRGAARFGRDCLANNTIGALTISREEYEEKGHHYCNEKLRRAWCCDSEPESVMELY